MQRNPAIALHQALEQSPTLARLSALARQSNAQLSAIEPLLTPALRACARAGPVDGDTWCLLVSNSAAAAKLRQLEPRLQQHLRERGWEINAIRIKIQIP